MDKTQSFAILAAVPEVHLISGQDVCLNQGKVAFGSMAFEAFRKVDEMREDKAVEILIYASDAANRPLNTEVTWHGLYIGHVQSRGGRYLKGSQFRPPSTASEKPIWAIFWEVQDLKPLSSPIAIASLKGLERGSNLKSRFVPESPLLIEAVRNP